MHSLVVAFALWLFLTLGVPVVFIVSVVPVIGISAPAVVALFLWAGSNHCAAISVSVCECWGARCEAYGDNSQNSCGDFHNGFSWVVIGVVD